ncbi:MAG: repeat-containing protein [Ignavibacteria bacterium]|nr:repeat-containing protein [Ignavibacteria bacterium]
MKCSFTIILLAVVFSFCFKSNLEAQDDLINFYFGQGYNFKSLAFSSDNRFFAFEKQNIISLYDTKTLKLIKNLYELGMPGVGQEIRDIAFSPDGNKIISGENCCLKLWDIKSGDITNIIIKSGSTDNLTVAYSPDGNKIASGNYSNNVYLWDIYSDSLFATLSGHTNWVKSVIFNNKTDKLISGSKDSTIKIWDLTTNKLINTLYGHNGEVNSVKISSDDSNVLSGSKDSTIKIWDLNEGKLIKTLYGHNGSVNSISVSKVGNYLVSGSDDSTVKIWDLNTGTLQKTYNGYKGGVIYVAISPDGSVIASSSLDNYIRIWKGPNFSVEDVNENNPNNPEIINISPNPANENSEIQFSLDNPSFVNLSITNSLGCEVARVIDNIYYEQGKSRVTFDATNFSPGVYFCTLRTNALSKTVKFIVMK